MVNVMAGSNPLHDEQGHLIGAMNILMDLATRTSGAEMTSELAAIVESSDDAIVSKSLDGIILSWNRGAERIFGFTADEAIGSPITMVIPQELHLEEKEILSRLRRGERVDHYETIRLTRDGRPINISLTVSPVRDHTGRIIGASKIARDITRQTQADAALAELNDQLAAQLAELTRLHEMSTRLSTMRDLQPILDESLQTAVALADTDFGMISLCTDSEHLGIQASVGFNEELLNSFQTDAPGAGHVCLLERRPLIIENLETDPRFKDFSSLALQAGIRAAYFVPLANRSGEMVGVLSIYFRVPHAPGERTIRMIDLCARQAVNFIESANLYAQLQESHRRKDEFLAILAHELRNPLAPISNSLQILRMSDELSPSLQIVRQIMEQQVNYMVHLVDDLLEVSRITRGKIELRKQQADVATLIASAVEMTRTQMQESQVDLSIIVPAEPIMIEVDAVRMTQVIANLLNNAAKYTDIGGSVQVTAARHTGQLVLSVRDTGVGIPAEMLERIFEMFSQIDRTTNRSRGGLGIGLTLARKLVALHSGTISASSSGLGHGSEFTIQLPISNVGPPEINTVDCSLLAEPRLAPRNILVVDDTRAAAYVLSKLLESLGQNVLQAHDGETALRIAVETQPQIVFSDIAMPGMDGYELARRIRSQPTLNNVVLVAVTGFGQREDQERTRDAGFNLHLVKPASLQAIRELLAAIPSCVVN